MIELTSRTTMREQYDPAMSITTQKEADAYFEVCVQHSMNTWGVSRVKAEEIERENLGYYAGYFDHETRARVERLFKCAHPIFGAIDKVGAPTFEEAFQAGLDFAKRKFKQ